MAPTPRKIFPRKKFAYDEVPPKPATEPPLPFSLAARNHVPNPYVNTNLIHEQIIAIRAKASIQGQDMDYQQSVDLYPSGYPYFVRGRDSLRQHITSLFTTEIAMYDGAMGTMIQNYAKRSKLDEEEFRGERFKDWTCPVKGNNDMLSISQPQIIRDIYHQYLVAGSHMIGTNTFSSTTIAMADYEMEAYAYELNYAAAKLAR